MNDTDRLIADLNLRLDRIGRALEQANILAVRRQPYKPLLIVLPGGDLTQEQAHYFMDLLKDYFESIEPSSTRATREAESDG